MIERHDVLFNQRRTYRQELLDTVAGVDEAAANVVPKGFRNNVRWHLGHVELDQAAWLAALTGEPSDVPPGHAHWFDFGTEPSHLDGDTPSCTDLCARLAEQPERNRRRYGHRLEERFEPTEMGMRTVEQVLVRTVFHEGIHLANVVDILRFVCGDGRSRRR
jgi:uncharacterized damage-inducible protein DinB